jgi:hypothetical protein
MQVDSVFNSVQIAPHNLFSKMLNPTLQMPQIKRVVFVSGKMFYELYHARAARKIRDVTFVRLEQIAPFPFDRMAAAAALYPKAQLVWAQVILPCPWICAVSGAKIVRHVVGTCLVRDSVCLYACVCMRVSVCVCVCFFFGFF